MGKKPPIDEVEFLRRVRNHGELSRCLSDLNLPAPDLPEYVRHVAECWFRLGADHLDEAERANTVGCARTTLSRAYYAAYNASKAIRYLVYGVVSLKGDDHGKASSLPDDFPEPDKWAEKITDLYVNRLLADYDNWSSTATTHTLTPESALKCASQFLDTAREYVDNKFGITL
jgi:uncharacterized protein (UPF0332 family)